MIAFCTNLAFPYGTVVKASGEENMSGLGHSYVAEVLKVFRDLFYIGGIATNQTQRARIAKLEERYLELT